ncbi:MAG: CinA family protein [Oscillospiraceae bacterium]|nr:CinA family protein [Oscillospiraceae bacterium]
MQTTKNDNSVTKSIDFVTTFVVKLLRQQGSSVSTAESCTGGMLAQAITSVSGASEIFEMGVVSYSNRIKSMLLDVPEDILLEYGAVSQQTAVLMAQGVLKKSGSDIGVGITGIAGPTGGTKDKPVGTVYVAVVKNCDGEQKILVRNLALYKEEKELTRDKARELTVQKALEMILEICEADERNIKDVNDE